MLGHSMGAHRWALRMTLPLGATLAASATAVDARRCASVAEPLPAASTRSTHSRSRSGSGSGSAGQPAMLIGDPDAFARKWKRFCADGASRLLVITDFDQTLTPHWAANGTRATSSHGLLMGSTVMPTHVRERERELFAHYYPIEASPSLSRAEKLPLMLEWWGHAHAALLASGLRREQLQEAVAQGELPFRDGFHDVFRLLQARDVPTLVFSAGLYDVIHAALAHEWTRQQGRAAASTLHNVHVVANMMAFDAASGLLTGFQGEVVRPSGSGPVVWMMWIDDPVIHSLNKNAGVLHGSAFQKQCHQQGRRNILLLGDSRGDVNMATGLYDQAVMTKDAGVKEGVDMDEDVDVEVIRVGFLNTHVDEALDEYLALYDVVLTHDASLRPVEMLLAQIQ